MEEIAAGAVNVLVVVPNKFVFNGVVVGAVDVVTPPNPNVAPPPNPPVDVAPPPPPRVLLEPNPKEEFEEEVPNNDLDRPSLG